MQTRAAARAATSSFDSKHEDDLRLVQEVDLEALGVDLAPLLKYLDECQQVNALFALNVDNHHSLTCGYLRHSLSSPQSSIHQGSDASLLMNLSDYQVPIARGATECKSMPPHVHAPLARPRLPNSMQGVPRDTPFLKSIWHFKLAKWISISLQLNAKIHICTF